MKHPVTILIALLLAPPAVLLAADLPDWFEANRVQAHCDSFKMQDDSGGLPLHQPIAALGAKALTLVVDNLDEGAWWPSAVGETHPFAKNRDVAREIIESVHGHGMKCIGYYRDMSDAWSQREHPEWLCRDASGQPVHEPRGQKTRQQVFVLCDNSPYRDFVQTRLCELAQRGIDMIYFDSWHMPEVCTCESCRRKFEAVTGKPFPIKPTPKAGGAATEQIEDADGKISLAGVYTDGYLEVCRFVSQSLQEVFTQWRAAVTKINPRVRFAIGSSLYPLFVNQPHLTADFVALADSAKTEFQKEFGGNADLLKRVTLPGFAPPTFDITTALGWSLVRDGCDGRPPLMWIPPVETEQDALWTSAAAYSYGCVADITIRGKELGVRKGHECTAPGLFASSFANGAKISPALAHTRPYGWAAIHASERARNRRLNDLSTMWKEVIAPVVGAFEAMVREHLPVVTINDRQLASEIPAETRVLVLASPDEVTDAQRAAIARWTQRGGVVLRIATGGDWYSATGKPARMKALLADIQARAGQPPIRVVGPKDMHAVFFRHPQGGRLVVALVNAWDNYELKTRAAKPPRCAGVTLELDPTFFSAATATEMLSQAKLPMTRTRTVMVKVPDFEINRCVMLTP